jgi:hypothetical protein
VGAESEQFGRRDAEIGQQVGVAGRVGVGRHRLPFAVHGGVRVGHGDGEVHGVDLDGGRAHVAQQQRPHPGLLGERGIGSEHPQVLAVVQAQDHQVRIVGLDEQQRQVGGRVDVAQTVGHVLDVGGIGQRDFRGRPFIGYSDRGGGEVGHGSPGSIKGQTVGEHPTLTTTTHPSRSPHGPARPAGVGPPADGSRTHHSGQPVVAHCCTTSPVATPTPTAVLRATPAAAPRSPKRTSTKAQAQATVAAARVNQI